MTLHLGTGKLRHVSLLEGRMNTAEGDIDDLNADRLTGLDLHPQL